MKIGVARSTRVVVIGTGPGGAACAALLSQAGFEVTALERNPFPGGKCATGRSNGYAYDMGVHISTRGEKGPHGEVARRVGADLTFLHRDPFLRLIMGNREHRLPLDFKSLRALYDLARRIGVKPHHFPNLYRMVRHIFTMRSLREASRFDSLPLRDYVSRFTRDPQIHLFINLFSCFFLVVPYERASAGEFLYCFANALQDASWGYPRGGFQEISASFLRAAQRNGTALKLGEPVTRIRVKAGRARGVETEKGVYEADIVISNAGIRRTLELAGKENFPSDYAARVLALEDSFTGITVKFGLRERFLEDAFVLYTPGFSEATSFLESLAQGKCPAEPALFMPVPSNLDSQLAPAGKQLLIAGTMGPPHLSMSAVAAAELDLVERTVMRLFPGIESRVEWSLRTDLATVEALSGRGSADVVGVAQTWDQCGPKRPDAVLPVAGLYQVGSDAGGRGVGTELAVDSALRLAGRLTRRS